MHEIICIIPEEEFGPLVAVANEYFSNPIPFNKEAFFALKLELGTKYHYDHEKVTINAKGEVREMSNVA